jgi:hypothetical protein
MAAPTHRIHIYGKWHNKIIYSEIDPFTKKKSYYLGIANSNKTFSSVVKLKAFYRSRFAKKGS